MAGVRIWVGKRQGLWLRHFCLAMLLLTLSGLTLLGGATTTVKASTTPVITSLSSNYGWENMSVTINGSGFGSTQGSSYVRFGELNAGSYSSWSDTKIVCTVPAGNEYYGGRQPVQVVTSGGASTPKPFAVIHKTFTRVYKSSIDGTELRCSIYLPADKINKTRFPVMVSLHAFGGQGGINPFLTFDPLPGIMDSWADTYGFMVISPWGRNYQGLYADGRDLGTQEPCIFDDFSTDNTGPDWLEGYGNWSYNSSDKSFEQLKNDDDNNWCVAERANSTGSSYSISVDITKLSASVNDGNPSCYGGIFFRKQSTGECYTLFLQEVGSDPNNMTRGVKLYRYKFDNQGPLAEANFNWDPNRPNNLKVIVYGDSMKVMINGNVVSWPNVDPTKDLFAYDGSFSSGSVGLLTCGGAFRFDNFRVQNEFLYGETDVMDCLNQFLEEMSDIPNYRADPSKICLEGYSMGGLGTYALGLHFPDVFAALHPAMGVTDVEKAYNWIKTWFPDGAAIGSPPEGGYTWCGEQDANITETVEALMDYVDMTTPLALSNLRQYSARYILENALNTPMRIEHQEYDALIPNTTSGGMKIWWREYNASGNKYISLNTVQPDFAQDQSIWSRWLAYPGLLKVPNPQPGYPQETSGFGEHGTAPSDPNNIWDNKNYTDAPYNYPAGSHGAVTDGAFFDQLNQVGRIVLFFNRVVMNSTTSPPYIALHTDPDEVAYRTYDAVHTGSWWLRMEGAYPDQNIPALARVKRDKGTNKITAGLKNVKTLTLDVKRMGMNTASGKTLTIVLNNNTQPEAEPGVPDTYNSSGGKVTLKLVGEWYPKKTYTVKVNGSTVTPTVTGTTLTISNLTVSGTDKTVTVTMPSGQTNLLASYNPGFESGTASWTAQMDGGLNGLFEIIDEKANAHTGNYAARIKDAKATASPYRGMWMSSIITSGITAGTNYTASAFVKTRSFNSVVRTYLNGKYDPASSSSAYIAIQWLNSSNAQVGSWVISPALRDTNDWKPLEVTGKAPTGATRARVILFTQCPNAGGISGSVWFDDVAMR